MATDLPRITISFPPDLYQTISKLARLQKRPKSAIVVELLGAAAEPLARTADLLEAALQAPEEAKRNLLAAAEEADARFKTAQGIVDGQLDLVEEAIRKPRKKARSKK